jgi:hypothetical protein
MRSVPALPMDGVWPRLTRFSHQTESLSNVFLAVSVVVVSALWEPFGSHGRHRGVLPYKSTLFFVLDEAGQKMATTATMDTNWFRISAVGRYASEVHG